MTVLLGLKLFLAPLFVWIISILQGRYNARLGGLFLGLPLTTGPFLLIIGIQEGRSFAKTAASISAGVAVTGKASVNFTLPLKEIG